MDRIPKSQDVTLQPVNNWSGPANSERLPNAAPILADYLKAIHKVAPDWAMAWLADQFLQGHLWWEPFTDHLINMPETALQRILGAALDLKLDVNTVQKRAVQLGRSGSPLAANKLVKECLAFAAQDEEQPGHSGYDRGDALKAGLGELPGSCLLDAVLSQAQETREFTSLRRLTELVEWSDISQVPQEKRESLRSLVFRLEDLRPEPSG